MVSPFTSPVSLPSLSVFAALFFLPTCAGEGEVAQHLIACEQWASAPTVWCKVRGLGSVMATPSALPSGGEFTYWGPEEGRGWFTAEGREGEFG